MASRIIGGVFPMPALLQPCAVGALSPWVLGAMPPGSAGGGGNPPSPAGSGAPPASSSPPSQPPSSSGSGLLRAARRFADWLNPFGGKAAPLVERVRSGQMAAGELLASVRSGEVRFDGDDIMRIVEAGGKTAETGLALLLLAATSPDFAEQFRACSSDAFFLTMAYAALERPDRFGMEHRSALMRLYSEGEANRYLIAVISILALNRAVLFTEDDFAALTRDINLQAVPDEFLVIAALALAERRPEFVDVKRDSDAITRCITRCSVENPSIGIRALTILLERIPEFVGEGRDLEAIKRGLVLLCLVGPGSSMRMANVLLKKRPEAADEIMRRILSNSDILDAWYRCMWMSDDFLNLAAKFSAAMYDICKRIDPSCGLYHNISQTWARIGPDLIGRSPPDEPKAESVT